MYSCAPLHVAKQSQDDQLEPPYRSFVPIQDVALKTCWKKWTIGRGGEWGLGMMRHDDNYDDDESLTTFSRIWSRNAEYISYDDNRFVRAHFPGNSLVTVKNCWECERSNLLFLFTSKEWLFKHAVN